MRSVGEFFKTRGGDGSADTEFDLRSALVEEFVHEQHGAQAWVNEAG